MQSALLQKYGEARLPRYTSYPTAPHFTSAVGPTVHEGWLAALDTSEPLSIYLHVPFCRAMCWYCGCHTTITLQDRPIRDYLEVIAAEIRLVAERVPARMLVQNVHFGGGTPTIVQPAEFLALTGLLRERFEFTTSAEIAVEIDPRTLTEEMAAALGGAGVRRASLGVQSFDPLVQRAVNRIQSEEQTRDTVMLLRHYGVERINFDLIYGLPHQTVRSCVETALSAAAMRPDRLAVFGYAHVPSFKKHQRMIDEHALPDSAARSEQAEAIAEALVGAGYHRIGLDHFALPDDDLSRAATEGRLRRNFQGYTTDTCTTLIGFGASAIGRTPEGYVQNEVALGRYARQIAEGCLATAKGLRLTAEDRLRADIIERLMCDMEADIAGIAVRHGRDPAPLLAGNDRLMALCGEGLVDIDGGKVILRERQRFLVRVVASAFDARLATSPRSYSKAA